ncbi:alpha-N-arabinofuranosidase [Anaerosporobacter sp.]|uniref:alpha-N-arabinofuranosidase n=1 Tax=Anaerosporobacter sp. TaxID=1872529 RepID=UPI00286ECDBC|nr:alpha-L-arabinofuranosidase C-terminal domain-containing protein [Anaerosporobacter sp.]
MKQVKLFVNAANQKSKINREIYGHFSEHLGRCIYEGIYVGEESSIPNKKGMRNDVVEALKEIKTPVLRWPGGCFADEYHWKDGIGPKEGRKRMVNTNWGGVVEDNSFGTHEFMELCEQIGCEPYIAGNVGSGTVQELAEWIEYMTFDGESPMANLRKKNGQEKPWKLKYLGIGNENWGCGGSMFPEYYAHEYRRYQEYCKNLSGNELYKIACGPNSTDYDWTDKLMSMLTNRLPKAIALHYYVMPGTWAKKGSATDFSTEEYYNTMHKAYMMDEIIEKHCEIMSRHDKEHKVGLIVDEWGNWFDVEPGTNPGFLYQQNTMRDAITAAITLNIFNQHSDRVVMANIAQVVNVLQAVILTEGEKMIKTPTFHIFRMYRDHQDATLLDSYVENNEAGEDVLVPALSQSASISEDGSILLTISNCDLAEDYEVVVDLVDREFSECSAELLQSKMDGYNSFEDGHIVEPVDYNGYRMEDKKIILAVPACSVVSLKLKR